MTALPCDVDGLSEPGVGRHDSGHRRVIHQSGSGTGGSGVGIGM